MICTCTNINILEQTTIPRQPMVTQIVACPFITGSVIRTARVIQVLGIAFTAYDITQASNESFRVGSAKPITAELVRQAGGWGAAWAGFKIGTVAGAAVGIETGPGAVISGLAGGLIFGAAGYFGADWVADHIYEN